MSTYSLYGGSVRIPVLLLLYSGGIDLCIVHSCMYPSSSTFCLKTFRPYLSDTSSIAQHLKKHSCPTAQLRKILTDNTTILEHQNHKQKLQILEALHIRNLQPTLNRINFQTSANVLKCL